MKLQTQHLLRNPFTILDKLCIPRYVVLGIPIIWWFFPLLPTEYTKNRAIRTPFSESGSIAVIQSLIYGAMPVCALGFFRSCSQVSGFLPLVWSLLTAMVVLLAISHDKRKALTLFSTILALLAGSAFSWLIAHFWLSFQTLYIFRKDFQKPTIKCPLVLPTKKLKIGQTTKSRLHRRSSALL